MTICPSDISLGGPAVGYSIACEILCTGGTQISMDDACVRDFAYKTAPNAQISFSDFQNRALCPSVALTVGATTSAIYIQTSTGFTIFACNWQVNGTCCLLGQYRPGKTTVSVCVCTGVCLYSCSNHNIVNPYSLYASMTCIPALEIVALSSGDKLVINNSGYILGGGGQGGGMCSSTCCSCYGNLNGCRGNPAIMLPFGGTGIINCINNTGVIAGGGGGGGGSEFGNNVHAGGGGGAGGGFGGLHYYQLSPACPYPIGQLYPGGPAAVSGYPCTVISGAAGTGPQAGGGTGGGGGYCFPGSSSGFRYIGKDAICCSVAAGGCAGTAGGGGAGWIYDSGTLPVCCSCACTPPGGAAGVAGGTAATSPNVSHFIGGGGGGWGACGGAGYALTSFLNCSYSGGAGGSAVALCGGSVIWVACGCVVGAVA